jgi:electron transfer flavoprotein beta subunit
VKEINEPRVPSLKGKMRAKTIRIPVWGPEDLELTESEVGLKGSATWVTQIFAPKPRGRQIMLKGEVHEQVNQLLELLIQDKAISLH